jgi:hypothetical protein
MITYLPSAFFVSRKAQRSQAKTDINIMTDIGLGAGSSYLCSKEDRRRRDQSGAARLM